MISPLESVAWAIYDTSIALFKILLWLWNQYQAAVKSMLGRQGVVFRMRIKVTSLLVNCESQ